MVQKSEELDLLATKFRPASCRESFGRVFAAIKNYAGNYKITHVPQFQARRDLSVWRFWRFQLASTARSAASGSFRADSTSNSPSVPEIQLS
jgi:hypothetical protein